MDAEDVALRPRTSKCIFCEHPASAVTAEGLREALMEHGPYIDATADTQTDPHFEDTRLSILVAM